LPFPALQKMFDPSAPPGIQNYWKADFFNQLRDTAIALHVKYASQIPTMLSGAHLYPINGAAHRVGKNETAFSYRSANWSQIIITADPDPANNPKMIAWARDYWLALHPYSAGGAYVNFLMDESQDRVRMAYQVNYPRLATIKRHYDPDNLFHINQNIKPSGQPEGQPSG
jgi:FAD/FMN-containing dehydrogenase